MGFLVLWKQFSSAMEGHTSDMFLLEGYILGIYQLLQ